MSETGSGPAERIAAPWRAAVDEVSGDVARVVVDLDPIAVGVGEIDLVETVGPAGHVAGLFGPAPELHALGPQAGDEAVEIVDSDGKVRLLFEPRVAELVLGDVERADLPDNRLS